MALKLGIFLLASIFLVTAEENAFTPVAVPPADHSQAPTPGPAPAPAPPKIVYVNISECPGLCLARCAENSRPNHCHRACGTCCERCRCVPPGTYGNREACGSCYADMLTHHNRTKCP